VTDAIITEDEGEKTGAGATRSAIDEKTYGLWICLTSEAIVFALLCVMLVAMGHNAPDGSGGNPLFSLPRVFAQTMLLLASSATFGFAGVAIAAGRSRRAVLWLSLTFLLGSGFILAEVAEFHGMVAAGAGPWRSGYLSAFFTLVGTHGAHVGIGLIWIVLLGCEVALRGVTPFAASRVHRLGLFWHFLVIVWIAIFSLVYLPGLP
jgi:cytochrome o ubiquinol oxidase subunit 3